MKNFKRVEKFNYKKRYFTMYINKNDSVYDLVECTVLTWKSTKRGMKPDEVSEARNVELFNKIQGNPFVIALYKIKAEIDLT